MNWWQWWGCGSDDERRSIWRNENCQGKLKYSEKTCPSAISSNTNPTWTDPGWNPACCSEKPATYHLWYSWAYLHFTASHDRHVGRAVEKDKKYQDINMMFIPISLWSVLYNIVCSWTYRRTHRYTRKSLLPQTVQFWTRNCVKFLKEQLMWWYVFLCWQLYVCQYEAVSMITLRNHHTSTSLDQRATMKPMIHTLTRALLATT
jgi:hypothetical protein